MATRIASALLSGACCLAAYSADYSCVRSGVSFTQMPGETGEGGAVIFSGTGNAPLAFPRTVDEVPRTPTDWDGWTLKFDDCSDESNVCREVSLTGRQDWRAWRYVLALPRVLQAGKSYVVRGVRVVVAQMPRAAADSPLRLQAKFLKEDGGLALPFTLTLEQGIGLVFLDGMRFRREDQDSGELCVLRSESGILSDVVLEGQ